MKRRVIFIDPELWTTPKENRVTEPYKPPRDVVPPAPPNHDEILRWNDTAGTVMYVSEPGEVLTGPDGKLLGVGPTSTSAMSVSGAVVLRSWLDAAGLTDDDVPNLTVIDC